MKTILFSNWTFSKIECLHKSSRIHNLTYRSTWLSTSIEVTYQGVLPLKLHLPSDYDYGTSLYVKYLVFLNLSKHQSTKHLVLIPLGFSLIKYSTLNLLKLPLAIYLPIDLLRLPHVKYLAINLVWLSLAKDLVLDLLWLLLVHL